MTAKEQFQRNLETMMQTAYDLQKDMERAMGREPDPSHPEAPALPHAPLKVQVSPLCGPERHFWLHPDLCVAILAWSMDPHVCHPDGAFELALAYGNETSQVGRNKACRQFLEGDMDYLLMVDNDTIPRHPVTGEYLNLMAMAHWGQDIVAALVPTTTLTPGGGSLTWGYNAYKRHEDGYRMMGQDELEAVEDTDLRDDPSQPNARIPLKQVDVVGFGAVMLSRQVVEAVAKHDATCPAGPNGPWEHAPRLRPHENTINPVLRSRNRDGSTAFGEDFLFCHRAMDLGYLSYTAPSLYCDHAHTLDMGKLPSMRAARSPKAEPQPQTTNNPSQMSAEALESGAAEESVNVRLESGVHVSKLRAIYGLSHRVPPAYPPLPPITNYSIEPALADYLRTQITDRNDINSILELGSGISTVVIAEALAKKGVVRWLLSMDHDADYQRQVMRSLTEQELGFTAFYHRNLGPDGFYSNCAYKLGGASFDLLLIDGPPGQFNGRRHAHRVFNHVREGGLVIMDDCGRQDEAAAIQYWYDQGWLTQVQKVGRAMVMDRTGKRVQDSDIK